MYLTFGWLVDDCSAGYFLPVLLRCHGHASIIADGWPVIVITCLRTCSVMVGAPCPGHMPAHGSCSDNAWENYSQWTTVFKT